MSNFPTDINDQTTQLETKKPGFLHFVKEVLETLVLAVVLFVGVNAVVARIRVDGQSMEPTLVSGEYVMVNRLSYRFSLPQRGDIIVFHFPGDPQEEYIKRVIGLPGDDVSIHNNQVYINGQPLNESYIKGMVSNPASWKVPEGQLFVLGDNRNNSSDSREWGTVTMNLVVGKAIVVYWPPSDWGMVGHVALPSVIK